MGCFYTVKPGLLDEIGYFDEEEFPVRGHSHVDFTMRACRVGKMILRRHLMFWKYEYISMETRDNYVRTNKILGIWESSQINDKKTLENREKVLLMTPEYMYLGDGELKLHHEIKKSSMLLFGLLS